MPTPIFCCGAECGLNTPTQAGTGNFNSHWSAIDSPNVTVDTTIFAPGGTRSWKTTCSGNTRQLANNWASASAIGVMRFKVLFTQVPAVTTLIAWLDSSTSLFGLRYNTANGSMELYSKATGATAVGPPVVLNRWYLIDIKVNATANPWTSAWQVDGVPYGSISPANAAGTFTGHLFGNDISSTFNAIYYDDIVISNTEADYPFGNGYVLATRPNRDGSHSFTANDFKYNNTTGFSQTATDVYTYLDDLLDNTTDFIAQAVIRTTGYVEVGFAPLPQILINGCDFTVNGIEVVASFHASAGQAENFGMRLEDQGTEVILFSMDLASASLTNYRKHYAKSFATNNPWTPAQVSGIMARFGYSSDASPQPFVDAIVIEADLKPTLQIVSALDLILANSPRKSKSPMVFPLFISPQSAPTKELKSIDGLLV